MKSNELAKLLGTARKEIQKLKAWNRGLTIEAARLESEAEELRTEIEELKKEVEWWRA